MAWFEPPRLMAREEAVTTMTSAPFSAAATAQQTPAMPAPRITMSWVMVSEIWSSGMGSGAISKDHLVSAYLAAVMVSSAAGAASEATAVLAMPATAVAAAATPAPSRNCLRLSSIFVPLFSVEHGNCTRGLCCHAACGPVHRQE